MIFGNRSINKNLFLFNGQFEYIWKENKNSEFLLISYHNSFFAFFGNQFACNISCTKNIGIKNIIPIIMQESWGMYMDNMSFCPQTIEVLKDILNDITTDIIKEKRRNKLWEEKQSQ